MGWVIFIFIFNLISMFQLLQELDQLSAEVIPQANLTCDNARAHPNDLDAQNGLLDASKNLMDVSPASF